MRARDDARFLARIIERDGFAFVLDYGDASMVADASERVARGFSLWRNGKLETVSPSSSQLLPLLAEFYNQEGLVVSLEEPDFAQRPEPLDARLPALPQHSITDFRDQTEETEEETELVSYAEIPDLADELEMIVKTARTNPGAVAKRPLWRPDGVEEPVPLTGPVPKYVRAMGSVVPHDSDEEETELVSPEMRAQALVLEEGATELDDEPEDL